MLGRLVTLLVVALFTFTATAQEEDTPAAPDTPVAPAEQEAERVEPPLRVEPPVEQDIEEDLVEPVPPVQGLKARPRYGTEMPTDLPSIKERQEKRRMGLPPGLAGKEVPAIDATDKLKYMKQNRPIPEPVKWPPNRKKMERYPHPHPAIVSVNRPKHSQPTKGHDLVWVNMPGKVYFDENNNHVHSHAVQIPREQAIEMGYRPAYTPIPVRPAIETPKMRGKKLPRGGEQEKEVTE